MEGHEGEIMGEAIDTFLSPSPSSIPFSCLSFLSQPFFLTLTYAGGRVGEQGIDR